MQALSSWRGRKDVNKTWEQSFKLNQTECSTTEKSYEIALLKSKGCVQDVALLPFRDLEVKIILRSDLPMNSFLPNKPVTQDNCTILMQLGFSSLAFGKTVTKEFGQEHLEFLVSWVS